MNREKMNYQKSFVVRQNEMRQEILKSAKDTEAWSKLSQKQQKLIEIFLFIQNRANRNKVLNSGKYEKSVEYMDCYNCHKSIYALENNSLFQADYIEKIYWSKIRTVDFFETQYKKVNSYEESEKIILKHGFPCVVHIASFDNGFDCESINYKNAPNNFTIWHSLLVLGKNKKDDSLVIWHKIGCGCDCNFEINDWQSVYEGHVNHFRDIRMMAIGVRPLGNREMQGLRGS